MRILIQLFKDNIKVLVHTYNKTHKCTKCSGTNTKSAQLITSSSQDGNYVQECDISLPTC